MVPANVSFATNVEQGLVMKIRHVSAICAVLAAIGVSLATVMPAGAQSDAKNQPSDRTVDFLKTFVHGFLIPKEIPLADGSKIKVDRANKEEMKKFDIPRDDMRRVIRLAYNGANAEVCNRIDLQEGAFQWMKQQERKKNKWSKQQLFFISRLYLATVMWQTGRAQVVAEDQSPTEKVATKTDKLKAAEPKKKVVCTDAKKKGVERFEAFLKSQKKS